MGEYDTYIALWATVWAVIITVGVIALGVGAFFIGRCSV